MATDKHVITLPGGLFPFRREQLMQFDYLGYRLQNVYGIITDEQRTACVELWRRNRVLVDESAARQRSDQVCYYITSRDTGELIGVNTIYSGQLNNDPRVFMINRMFIDPAWRNSRLMITGTAMMICFCKIRFEDRAIAGVINVNENVKLSRPGMSRIFERLGYREIGWQKNKQILLFDFSRIEIVDA